MKIDNKKNAIPSILIVKWLPKNDLNMISVEKLFVSEFPVRASHTSETIMDSELVGSKSGGWYIS